MFSQNGNLLRRERKRSSNPASQCQMTGDRGGEAVVGRGGHIKRPGLLDYLHISFLMDSRKKLLHTILGSQETKEEVINGDQLLLLFC